LRVIEFTDDPDLHKFRISVRRQSMSNQRACFTKGQLLLSIKQKSLDMSMSNAEKALVNIRRKTRRKGSTQEKIRIVLEGLRGEMSLAELCQRSAYVT
jgi:hypothetical protein